jgi:ABC-type glycerol-3-phosphate transport system permease component
MSSTGRAPLRAYLLLVASCAVFALPLWWTLITSLRPPGDGLFADVYPFSILAFVPRALSFDSYSALFGQQHFASALLNSVAIAGVTVVLGVVVNGLAGFAFAVMEFPGRRILFALVIFSFLIPLEAILIPLYLLVDQVGWIDTYAALIIPMVPNGLVIFLFRQFFAAIPKDMYDAAAADGAGPLRVLWSIYLPMARPAVITASLIILLRQWQAYLWPLLTVRSPDRWTVQLVLGSLRTERQTDWGILLAGIAVSSVIPILLLVPLQKYMQLSFVQGSVKA